MNKKIKYLTFIFLATTLFFFNIKFISANTINEITMDVYIDKNGNAKITEVWNAFLSKGTEGYKPYSNLENKEITNFIVKDDSGKTYSFQTDWDTSASFNDKAYKNGFNNTYNGVELCWGISDYGLRTYTLTYDISNFVTKYTDNQGIYFNFINFDQSIGNVIITIHSDIPFSLDNARIWGFGNNGEINFENDKIVFKSNGTLNSDDYMTALVRFQTDLFETNNTSYKSFDDIYNEAMSDVETTKPKINIRNTLNQKLGDTIYSTIIALFGFIPIMFYLIYLYGRSRMNYIDDISNKLNIKDKKLPSIGNIQYYREIPCDKNIFIAYWIALKYNIGNYNELKENIIGAAILKWIKEKKITIKETEKGLFSFKDNNYAIDFSNMQEPFDQIEKKLYNILKEAAGTNNILEAKELKKWCKNNYEYFNSLFNTIDTNVESILYQKGFITTEYKTIRTLFFRKKLISLRKVNNLMKEEAIKLKGFKKFLLDFSTMPEKEHFEVHLWEEYLIFAQVLGIADKVEEQFSNLYPQFKEISTINIEITDSIKDMVEDGFDASKKAERREDLKNSLLSGSSNDYSGSSRDSGGGGNSYSSGGSSAGGSSGGGFR